jgi:AraC-like DNA-binding protein
MEGETYQSVLDKTRAVLAKRELSSGKYTIRDVALRVGFANVSAFHRAFKGWTGCTPTDFQARTMAQAGRATPRL